MALRVLLADESVTIKKVIQLALQDFAVEVKAVPVGLDVLEVSKSFQPDLVFADILLQKRSGYDVCSDLKKDPQTAAIPVVLMWSSFMELDQKQVDACGADGKLEKPFEVEMLRKLVLQLVPRTRSQRLAHYLDFPPTMAAPLKNEIPPPRVSSPPPPPSESSILEMGAGASPTPASEGSVTKTPLVPERPFTETGRSTEKPIELGALPDLQLDGEPDAKTPAAAPSKWNMESFDQLENPALSLDDDEEDDSFQPIQLPQVEPKTSKKSPYDTPLLTMDTGDDDDSADQWANKSLDKYRIPPLQPEESMSVDDTTPQFAASTQVDIPVRRSTASSIERAADTETGTASHDFAKLSADDDESISEFTLTDNDQTARLEIEPVSAQERSKPEIVRELLREPDLSVGASPSSYSTPSAFGSTDRMEAMVRSQIEPTLERVIEKVVAQLLPEIAERIIKRELERLLEDSSS